MSEGAVCSICFAGSLYMQAGMLICDACGNTVQEFAEETQEFQTGISDARFFRQHQAASQPSAPVIVEEVEPPKIWEGLQAYASSLQDLLKAQVKFLIEECGLTRQFEEVVKTIWFKELANSKILDRSLVTTIESLAEHRRIPEAKFQGFKLVREAAQEIMWAALPYSISLAILCLGCWCVREAIGPLEIIRYAFHGRLPYLDFYEFSREKMLPTKLCTVDFLHPSGLPSPFYIYIAASKMANSYKIICPPINAGLWIQYYIKRFSLPEEVGTVATTLFSLYEGEGRICNYLSCDLFGRHPWLNVMAYLAIAIKMCCVVDGRAPIIKTALSQTVSRNWIVWSETHIKKSVCAFPLTIEDAIKASQKGEFASYGDYLETFFFRNFTCPEGFEEYRSLLRQLAMTLEKDRHIFTEDLSTNDVASGKKLETRLSDYRFLEGKKHAETYPEFAAIITALAMEAFAGPSSLTKSIETIETQIRAAESKALEQLHSLG